MQMPLRAQILRGLLGADLVGFQEKLAAQNFVRLARHLLGFRYSGSGIDVDGRTTRAAAFPISIDAREMADLAASPEVQARAKQVRAELGNPKTVILGVDRLDYTKGIELRLEAFRELLEEGALKRARRRSRPGRDTEPRARRALRGAADEGRARGGEDQRRLRTGRSAGRALPAAVVRPERACGALLRRRRDGGDAVARRDEPGREGVRRGADRSRRGAGAERVRRCRKRVAARVPLQPPRPRRGERRHRAGDRRRPCGRAAAHATHAAPPSVARREPVGAVVPRRPGRPGGAGRGSDHGRLRERPPATSFVRDVCRYGTQRSASGVTCSSCVAPRTLWSARKRTAAARSRGSASASTG